MPPDLPVMPKVMPAYSAWPLREGGHAVQPHRAGHGARRHGRPVQVEPVKPTVKAPGSKLLKL
jgi:hypothetical protein